MLRPESFLTFGDLLKYLRIRAQLSQRDLAIAVGYSEAQISRLESNKRPPNPDALNALFVPALMLEDAPELAGRLLELAETVRKSSNLETDIPLSAASNKHHNLPAELTSLVGRETELAEIARLLDLPTTRLLTLTGSGGCGKTRLALRSGYNLAENYQHGVWLVELAPLSDPVLITQSIIGALGLLVDPNRQSVDTLLAFLKERKIMLILDNCEHLIDSVAQLVVLLLRACPDLKILSTSREALGVPGEVTYLVPSLAIPELNWDGALEAATAAQLFLERAGSVRTGFQLMTGERSALARICRRLDGIPLAIELAAARVSALPVSLIADRLEEGFAVLGSGGRGMVPRQATLQATVAWSYNLLSVEEQILLRRLPMFAGGWLLEQAEEVCICNGVEREAVLDLLVSLVSKSLVSAERLPNGAMRYRLHEMVRQYAYERLVEAGEEETLRRCFLDFFIRLAEQAEPELKGPRQMVWLERLDDDQENLNEALSMAVSQRDALSALRLSGALTFYWIYRDRGNEGRRWLETGLALPVAAVEAEPGAIEKSQSVILSARAKALTGLLWHRLFTGQLIGDEVAYECEQIYMKLGDTRGVIIAHSLLEQFDDLDGRIAQLRASLPVLLSQGDEWSTAFVLFQLWELERRNGNFEAGKDCQKECLRHLYPAGDRFFLARVLQDSVWLEWDNGRIRKAYELAAESLNVLNQVGLISFISWSYYYMAYFSAALGNFTDVYENLKKEKYYYEVFGGTWVGWHLNGVEGRFYYHEGRLTEAQKKIEAGLEVLEKTKHIRGPSELMMWLGLVFLYQNHLDRSEAVLEKCLAIAEQDDHHTFLHGPLRALGMLRLAQGDLSSAHYLLDRALAEITRNRTLPDFPETLDVLAQLMLAEGKPDLAARLLGASDGLLARMEMVRYPVYQPEYDRCRAAAMDALGRAAFASAWAEGAAIGKSEKVIEEINAVLR